MAVSSRTNAAADIADLVTEIDDALGVVAIFVLLIGGFWAGGLAGWM